MDAFRARPRPNENAKRRPEPTLSGPMAPRPSQFLAVAILAVSTLSSAGCLYTSGRTQREIGPQISRETLSVIEPGRTTTEWLVGAFGQLASRVSLTVGRVILRYDCDVRTSEGSYLFMLVATSSNRLERTSWWFEIRNDVVMRYFGETSGPVTTSVLDPAPTPPPTVPAAWTAGDAQAGDGASVGD